MSLWGALSFETVRSTFGKRTTLDAFGARLAGVPADAPAIPEFLIYFNYLSPRMAARKRAEVPPAATSPGPRRAAALARGGRDPTHMGSAVEEFA